MIEGRCLVHLYDLDSFPSCGYAYALYPGVVLEYSIKYLAYKVKMDMLTKPLFVPGSRMFKCFDQPLVSPMVGQEVYVKTDIDKESYWKATLLQQADNGLWQIHWMGRYQDYTDLDWVEGDLLFLLV